MFVDSFLGEILTPAVVADRPTFHFFLHIFHHSRVFSLVFLVIFTFFKTLEMFLDGSEPPEAFRTAVTDVFNIVIDGDTLSSVFPSINNLPTAVFASLASPGPIFTACWSSGWSTEPGLELAGVASVNVRPLSDEVRHQSQVFLLAVRTFPPGSLTVLSQQV